MATGIAASKANEYLDDLASTYPFIQLHTGDPGASGTSNVADESTRQEASFGSASNGQVATNADLRWEGVAATEDYTHWSGWSAAEGGTCGWSGTIAADEVQAGNNFVIESGGLTYSFNTMS